MAVFDSHENKAYTIPIKGAYQFDQVIQTFQDEMRAARGGDPEAPDNEAIKKMAYMDQKLQLVNSFGTNKSRKKVQSMITNMVDETGITNAPNKGVRDQRLADRAQQIAEQQESLKKVSLTQGERRMHLYSRSNLLPSSVLGEVNYKLTYEALKTEDYVDLESLMITTVVRE